MNNNRTYLQLIEAIHPHRTDIKVKRNKMHNEVIEVPDPTEYGKFITVGEQVIITTSDTSNPPKKFILCDHCSQRNKLDAFECRSCGAPID